MIVAASRMAMVIVSVILVGAPTGGLFSSTWASGGSGIGTPDIGSTGSAVATLKLGVNVGSHGSDPFFAVVLTDVGTPLKDLVALGSYLNTTPMNWFRFGGAGESYDPTTQTNYQPPPSGVGKYRAYHAPLWNLHWFKSWCYSRTPHCQWLSYLPAEENDTRAAVHVAKWFHSVLGAVPTYWEFGNEPSAWVHYGKNYSTWSTSDHSAVTPLGYATMVHAYIQAVSALYPSDRYIGIEAACACSNAIAAQTAALNGPKLASMAYHSYPSTLGSSTVLGKFLGLLASASNITSTFGQFSRAVGSACRTCASIPLGLGEFQAGPFYSFSPLSRGYGGVPFLTGSVIQALGANVSQLTVFDSNMLFDTSRRTPTFEGLLFSRILANLTMGKDVQVSVTGSHVTGAWAILTQNGSHRSLLVVNANALTALNLTVPAGVFPVAHSGSYWSWSASTRLPTAHLSVTLPSSYVVAPEGILLLTT